MYYHKMTQNSGMENVRLLSIDEIEEILEMAPDLGSRFTVVDLDDINYYHLQREHGFLLIEPVLGDENHGTVLYRDVNDSYFYFDSQPSETPPDVTEYLTAKCPSGQLINNVVPLQSYSYSTCAYHCLNIAKYICDHPNITAVELSIRYPSDITADNELFVFFNTVFLLTTFPNNIKLIDYRYRDTFPDFLALSSYHEPTVSRTAKKVRETKIRDFRFLCPNNTVFDQQNFICTNWYDIDCKRSTKYYSKNDLFRVEEEETTTESEYPEYQQPLTYYEYVYEYDDPQSRADADYMYEYYDGEDNKKHRFDARARNRKGKSQDATGNNTNTLPSSTPTTTTSTTTTTTTTTSTTTPRPTTRPTTTTTTSTTTTTRRPPPTTYIHTTPLPITTLRPSLAFHTGTFRVGRPVVSITSSTKRESTSASGPDSRFDASPTRSTRQEEELNDHEVDELYRGVQDPFADIDWRRDSATSVTASTKTTYEQRFGTSGGFRNRQNSPHFSTASRNQEFTSTTMRNSRLAPTVTSTTEKVTVDNRRGTSSRGRGTVVRNRGSTGFTSARDRGSTGFTSARDRGSTGFTSARDRGSTGFTSARARQAAPDPGLEEFSNFRYYRTAFGDNGEAELPTSSAQNPRGRQQPTSASGRSATRTRVRPAGYISARSASRNTRYAVYG